MATNLVKDTIKVIEQIKQRGYITEREVLLLQVYPDPKRQGRNSF